MSWEPPRCSHDEIILACPDDACPEQNAYIEQHRRALELWDENQRDAARELLDEICGQRLRSVGETR